MALREFDPARLDVRAFARDGAVIGGEWPLSGFERLQDQLVDPDPAAMVRWQAQGLERGQPGGARQTWLELRAEVTLGLRCQRCLEALSHELRVQRRFLFVRDEDEAARVDDETDDEVLVVSRSLDLHQLLEDELLLELPLVPRHERCQTPLAAVEETAAHRPFDALAGLRRR